MSKTFYRHHATKKLLRMYEFARPQLKVEHKSLSPVFTDQILFTTSGTVMIGDSKYTFKIVSTPFLDEDTPMVGVNISSRSIDFHCKFTAPKRHDRDLEALLKSGVFHHMSSRELNEMVFPSYDQIQVGFATVYLKEEIETHCNIKNYEDFEHDLVIMELLK